MEAEAKIIDKRPRYWIPSLVGLLAMTLVVAVSWLAYSRLLGSMQRQDPLSLSFVNLFSKSAPLPSALSMLPGWILSYLAGAAPGALLVLGGRRRVFWLPTALFLAGNPGFWFQPWPRPLDLLLAVAGTLLGMALVLAPAIALLFVLPMRDELLPKPAWAAKTYLLVIAGLGALTLPLFWLLGEPRLSAQFSLASMLDGSTGRFAYALAFVIIGAGLGLRRRWLPAVPVYVSAFHVLLTPSASWGSSTLRSFAGTLLPRLAILYAAAAWPAIDRQATRWLYRWKPGDEVVLRERWGGGIWAARPAVVVLDSPSEQRFYIPIGAEWWYPADDDGEEMRLPLEDWRLEQGVMTTRHILSFAWRTEPYAILLSWDADWNFLGYYVNLQTPLERKETGFDYTDHVLDIEMSPDKKSWRRKDMEDLQRMVDEGSFTVEEAKSFYDWGETAVEHILYETPFDQDWSGWRPDPEWEIPELPEDWDTLD